MKLIIDCKDSDSAWFILDAVAQLAERLDEGIHPDIVKKLENVTKSIRCQLVKKEES